MSLFTRLRGEPSKVRRVLGWVVTLVAAALVLFALDVPNKLGLLTPSAFLRIPVEGLLAFALLMVLPPKARRVVAIVFGVVLALFTLIKLTDMGFDAALSRPFNLVLDWSFFGNGLDFVKSLYGEAGVVGAVTGAIVAVVAVLTLMALSMVRLANVASRHRPVARGGVLVLTVTWITCTLLGVQILPDVPLTSLARERTAQVREGLQDHKVFAKDADTDAFAGMPDDQLLTGLRGKDVMFTFVESYGRVAVEDPVIGPEVSRVLADDEKRLRAVGYSARTGYIRSVTFGGGSWLAHATTQSGLWITNQQRYNNLIKSDRLTISKSFQKAGWRTVGIEPGNNGPWPEGDFYGYDKVYDDPAMNYHGPQFGFSTMPDQFALARFQQDEYSRAGRGPLYAELVLTSSHVPWAPLPKLLDWNALGDGSVYNAIAKASPSRDEVWKQNSRIRDNYAKTIEYSITSLVSFVEKYADDNLVLVFLGDHQPNTTVTGPIATPDVPITIVAHDPAVLDRISSWGWTEGLKPAPNLPVWRMDTFRDKFLTAFGPSPEH